jgi:NADH:ubiquinone reductase (non-electrogenic)
LPAFSKQLIDYTEASFKEQNISIHTKTMVKEVHDKDITIQQADGSLAKMPYGLLVWATGNTSRPVVRNLMSKFPATQKVGRGLVVDDWMRMEGSDDIYAIGDASASKYAPTAQVASQQGKYLARLFSQLALRDHLEQEIASISNEDEKQSKLRRLAKVRNVKPFHYSHQGSLA